MKFYLPASSLFPLPFWLAARKAAAANFDGVEVVMFPKGPDRNKIKAVCANECIDFTLHEAWAYKDNTGLFYNRVASWLGQIHHEVVPLESQLMLSTLEPIVAYPRNIPRVLELKFAPKVWFQTCKTMAPGPTYKEFVRLVHEHNLSVVFDTQHVLEYIFNGTNVAGLGEYDPSELQGALLEAWSEIGARHVKEIHLNNFNPDLGGTRGRNTFLHDGRLNLKKFVDVVMEDGWDGIVTPEIGPNHLYRHSLPKLPFGWGRLKLGLLRKQLDLLFTQRHNRNHSVEVALTQTA